MKPTEQNTEAEILARIAARREARRNQSAVPQPTGQDESQSSTPPTGETLQEAVDDIIRKFGWKRSDSYKTKLPPGHVRVYLAQDFDDQDEEPETTDQK
jgi:hypothetical protein